MPAVALAHPLGNFTINHYAGVRIEPDQVLLDVVVDQAEIPTFQARLAFDTDEDGEVSDDEADAGRVAECETLAPSLELVVDGVRPALTLTHAGLTFPPGVGGLSTMRLVCEYRADLAAPIAAATDLTFADTSFPDRLGWREIVTTGSGVTVAATEGTLRETTTSDRLTTYPTDQLAQAPADKVPGRRGHARWAGVACRSSRRTPPTSRARPSRRRRPVPTTPAPRQGRPPAQRAPPRSSRAPRPAA